LEAQSPAVADSSQLAVIQKKLALDNKIRSGVNWFYWIAGLSLINSIGFFFNMTVTFVVGLGITQFVDGFLLAAVEDLGEKWLILRFVGFAIDLGIAGLFVLIGVLGRKRHFWPVIVGVVLYGLDALLLLLFQDWLAVIFHAWALATIIASLKSMKELAALEAMGLTEPVDSLRQRMALLPQAPPSKKVNQTVWVICGLVILAFFLFIILSAIAGR
jgi:hypothetical protein